MLAICSDLDETPNLASYCEQMRFLNSKAATSMGPGVGLEVGNTIYFDMPSDQFSYWNTNDKGRATIREWIQSGHVDCLHSFGDLANTRKHAARALEDLDRHNCKLKVWIDHALAPTNLDPGIMRGHGDEPGHPAYHSDLTMAYGIEFVWRGRVTSVIGQNTPTSLGGIWNGDHPLKSSETLLKEACKQVLARIGNSKYSLHKSNQVIHSSHLNNGTPVTEFIRSNPHWGGVSSCDTGTGIGDVLTSNFLDTLIERQGISILYTHLGKLEKDAQGRLPRKSVEAFNTLAKYAHSKKVLVTTTSRLLSYVRLITQASVELSQREGTDHFDITCPTRPHGHKTDMGGLTVYLPKLHKPSQNVSTSIPFDPILNPADETGMQSVSIPWVPLSFPE